MQVPDPCSQLRADPPSETIGRSLPPPSRGGGELARSEERFRLLYESAPLGYQSLDAEGCFLEVNPAWLRLLGYSRDEVIGHPFKEFLVPAQQAVFDGRFARFKELGEVHGVEFDMVGKDGLVRHVCFDGLIGRNADGRFRQTHCIMQDVSERKRAELALQASERKYRNLVESLQEGLWAIDVDGQTTFVNSAMAAMLGYTCEEMAGRHLFSFVSPGDLDACRSNLADRMKGNAERHEFAFVRKDGTRIDAIVSGSPVVDAEGRITGAIAAVIDISPMKQAELALKASEAAARESARLSQTLLDTMPCVAFLVRPHDRRVLASNKPAVALGVVPGAACHETFGLVSMACPWCPVQSEKHAPAERQRRQVEARGRVWDVHWEPVSSEVWLHYAFDITDLRKQEEELQRMQHALTHVERLSLVGEMVAGIAHEVNQPLYSIENFAAACRNVLAQPRPDLNQLRQWNDEIVEAAARAGTIIRRVRDFLRRAEMRRELAGINEVVLESVGLTSFETRRRRVTVDVALSPDVSKVRIDRVQIQQVLVNLILNASEAMEDTALDCRRLRIRTMVGAGSIVVEVADRGPGIPAARLKSIFEPFVTSKPEGLGLGLAISRTIVEAHGGRMDATSVEGRGSTLRFTLPIDGDESVDKP